MHVFAADEGVPLACCSPSRPPGVNTSSMFVSAVQFFNLLHDVCSRPSHDYGAFGVTQPFLFRVGVLSSEIVTWNTKPHTAWRGCARVASVSAQFSAVVSPLGLSRRGLIPESPMGVQVLWAICRAACCVARPAELLFGRLDLMLFSV